MNTSKLSRQFVKSSLAVTLRSNLLSKQLHLVQAFKPKALKEALKPRSPIGPVTEAWARNCSECCNNKRKKRSSLQPCPPDHKEKVEKKSKGQATGQAVHTCAEKKTSCLVPALVGLLAGLGIGYLLLPSILGAQSLSPSASPPGGGRGPGACISSQQPQQSADPFEEVPKKKKCPPGPN